MQIHKRSELNNRIYYTNSCKCKLFYGKIKEQKQKGVFIPEIYCNRNLLRYELRYTKRIGNSFNVDFIRASNLYEESFYCQLANNWYKEYCSIRKENKFIIDLNIMKKSKDFKDLIYLAGIHSIFGCETNAIEAINIAKKQKIFTNKMQVKRIKDMVKEMTNKKIGNEEPEIIKELNSKIKEIIAFYR